MVLPAVVMGIVTSYFGSSELPIRYTEYVIQLQVAVTIFLGSQSPAVMSRDLRFRVASLYFSRPLSRQQYVQAKYAGMAVALFILIGLPITLLLAGALLAELPLGEQLPDYLRAMAGAAIYAVVLAGIGLVVAAMTPRRGLGVAAVVGVLLVLSGLQAAVSEMAAEFGNETFARVHRPDLAVHPRRRRGHRSARCRVLDRTGAAGRGGRRRLRGGHGAAGRRLLRRPGRPLPEGAVMSIIELEQVSRWFGNVVAVNDVTMRLGPGVTGLLGPNGAGKSTLIHMMAGFLAPSAGSVTLDGRPLYRDPEIYREVGLVPEREEMYDALSGWRFVLANARLHKLPDPEAAARRAIATVEMADAQDRDIRTYSKGMKQRIKMATAIVHDPTVLLLDEPFNGMDPRQRLHLMDLLHELGDQGRTILFSSHILEEVEQIAGRIEVMVAGRHAASGDFREIRRLMTQRPHQYTIRSSDDRALASAVIAEPSTSGVQLVIDAAGASTVQVQATDFSAFVHALPQVATRNGIRLLEVRPADESLESVFSYLVTR